MGLGSRAVDEGMGMMEKGEGPGTISLVQDWTCGWNEGKDAMNGRRGWGTGRTLNGTCCDELRKTAPGLWEKRRLLCRVKVGRERREEWGGY